LPPSHWSCIVSPAICSVIFVGPAFSTPCDVVRHFPGPAFSVAPRVTARNTPDVFIFVISACKKATAPIQRPGAMTATRRRVDSWGLEDCVLSNAGDDRRRASQVKLRAMDVHFSWQKLCPTTSDHAAAAACLRTAQGCAVGHGPETQFIMARWHGSSSRISGH